MYVVGDVDNIFLPQVEDLLVNLHDSKEGTVSRFTRLSLSAFVSLSDLSHLSMCLCDIIPEAGMHQTTVLSL
jgi:hypothetical protein